MRNEEIIKVIGGAEIADDVCKRIKTVGVRGLDFDRAKELGVFQRIGNILCVAHTTIMAAYMVYSNIEYIINEINARHKEISREMNLLDKSFERFMRFWSTYYMNDESEREASVEIERLYHQIMRWMQMPETWQLGDEQRTKDETDIAIKMAFNNKVYTLRGINIKSDVSVDSESWAVIKYDIHTNVQTIVNEDMDKASALMIAKKMSREDTENMYIASTVRDIEEKRVVVIPFRAFNNGGVIGDVVKTIKKK